MPATLKEVVQELSFDTRPNGPDGCSNVDRITYVLEVFEMGAIDLMADYDFTLVVTSKDEDMVQAAKHLAILKLDLLHRLYNAMLVEPDEFTTSSSVLILAIQRINWHLMHLVQGRPTPPFPAIH